MPYSGFKLSDLSRSKLLRAFPPAYPEVIAHHVTHNSGVKKGSLPPNRGRVQVIGHADDGNGVQAAVVTVDGRTHRGDGKRYHVTISIDRSKGRKPAHSNDVVNKGFIEVEPFELETDPHVFESVPDSLIKMVLKEYS